MSIPPKLRQFLLPAITTGFLVRVAIVISVTWVVFSRVLIPVRIEGASMDPTYRDGQMSLCWRWRYLWTTPARGDIVAVRYSGRHYMLAKRVIGLSGDTVEFRGGVLFVNGEPQREPYVIHPCHWELPPRQVDAGKVYVVGDNRSIAIDDHVFGQTELTRIMGTFL